MTTERFAATSARTSGRSAAPWIGLGAALALISLAVAVPAVLGIDVHVRWFPPLHAEWMPRIGPGTPAAIALAVLAIVFGVDLARRLTWRMLLLAAFGTSLAWMLSLATVDGLAGIGVILDTQYEYLRTARAVTDVGALLRSYIAHIPLDSVENWPVHVAGHPPGAVLFFVLLARVGLGSGIAAGFTVTIIAATTSVAVLIVLRRLGAEASARRAAPFLALGPAAIWMSVSADAVFGAFAAWGLCLLACAATARTRARTAAWAAASGLVLGWCVMMSYGLPLLALLAVTVLLLTGRWSALPWAVASAVLVVLAFAMAGFAWWEAYPVLVDRYWAGVAINRPFAYWVWADLGALAVSAGPLVGAGAAAAIALLPRLRTLSAGERVTVALTVAALATVLVADLSGMSKAEVERIWLPFIPWLLLGTALLTDRWRRWGLAGQVCFAVAVQHLLATGW